MAADQGDVIAHYGLGRLNEHQGKYEAAIVHYRAGQAVVGPEETHKYYHNCIRRCIGAVVRAKQEEQKQEKQ
jgi:hypothetical protein